MPSCAVPTCQNNSSKCKKKDGITFHYFPRDARRRALWIKVIQSARLNDCWKPSNHTLICSKHFREESLSLTKCGLTRLKNDAIPCKGLALATKKITRIEEVLFRPSTSDINNSRSPSPASSNSIIGDIDIGDDVCVYDEKVFKKRKQMDMTSILRRKEKMCKRYRRLVKTLRQKTRRLIKKNETLKALVDKYRLNNKRLGLKPLKIDKRDKKTSKIKPTVQDIMEPNEQENMEPIDQENMEPIELEIMVPVVQVKMEPMEQVKMEPIIEVIIKEE